MKGRLFISSRAHLLFDLHKEIDARREEELAGGLLLLLLKMAVQGNK